MRKGLLSGMAILFLAVTVTAGCSRVQTYTVQKDRVDQELSTSTGNAGYLAGAPKEGDLQKPRKTTRTTYVAEVELGRPAGARAKVRKPKYEKTLVPAESSEEQAATEAALEEANMEAATTTSSKEPVVYTVQANDTLQKISLKFYGTTKKWQLIYDANKDVLKAPDRIYAGQVIKVPQE